MESGGVHKECPVGASSPTAKEKQEGVPDSPLLLGQDLQTARVNRLETTLTKHFVAHVVFQVSDAEMEEACCTLHALHTEQGVLQEEKGSGRLRPRMLLACLEPSLLAVHKMWPNNAALRRQPRVFDAVQYTHPVRAECKLERGFESNATTPVCGEYRALALEIHTTQVGSFERHPHCSGNWLCTAVETTNGGACSPL